MNGNGLFITFEGGEGCGKSTQLHLLAEKLRTLLPGREILESRSPGGTPAAEKIRTILKTPIKDDDLTPETELMLFAACHAQMCERLIRPALKRGAILLVDRFCDSTVVYQGAARGLDREWINRVDAFACKGTMPSLTILLDVDPVIGLPRTKCRTAETQGDRFDSETMAFHTAVRQGFLDLAAKEPQRFAVIDASPDVETVHAHILEVIRERLGIL